MQKIVLDVIPNGIRPRVYVNQYDIGRQFEISFREGGNPYYFEDDPTFMINGRKADNHVFDYTEAEMWDNRHYVITKSGSGASLKVLIGTTEQMTAAAGEVDVQLTFYETIAGTDIGTLNFVMVVQESPGAYGDPSESDVPDVARSVCGIPANAHGNVPLRWADMSSIDNLAITEATRTMTSQRVAGTYVFVKADDQLYEITTTINASGTLTPGTNATARSVGDVLSQLNSDITTLQGKVINYVKVEKSSLTFSAGSAIDLGHIKDLTGISSLSYNTVIGISRTLSGGQSNYDWGELNFNSGDSHVYYKPDSTQNGAYVRFTVFY